jgi:hypothetical protein
MRTGRQPGRLPTSRAGEPCAALPKRGPRGVPLGFTEIGIVRVADGELAELWQITDELGFRERLVG